MEFTQEELKAARMGEFQELAWHLHFSLKASLSVGEIECLMMDLTSIAEENQLGFAGQPGDLTVVSVANRKAVTVEEQQLLKRWLSTRPEVSQIAESDDNDYSDAWFEMLLCYGNNETEMFFKFFDEASPIS